MRRNEKEKFKGLLNSCENKKKVFKIYRLLMRAFELYFNLIRKKYFTGWLRQH